MCGSSNKAAKAAQEQQAQQQANIQAAIGQINSIYSSPSRQQQYTDLQNAVTQRNLQSLNQQQQDANRNLNFAMARQGLTGGSADADASARQEQLYNQGVLNATQAGQQASSGLQAADQQSKNSLIGLAESGLSATDASNQALDALQANAQNAQSQATAQSVADAFGGLGSYFTNSTNAAAVRNALQNPSGQGLFAPNQIYTGLGSTYVAPWLANPNVGAYFGGNG